MVGIKRLRVFHLHGSFLPIIDRAATLAASVNEAYWLMMFSGRFGLGADPTANPTFFSL